MYDALFPEETDRALRHRIDNPPSPRAPKVSIWGQAGELLAAPFKGVGQAVQETTRVANTVAPVVVGNPLAMTAAEQEEVLDEGGISREAIDQDLRRGTQALRPDPVTSTVASQVLQGATRVVAKAVGYGLAAGPVGAVVGTGIDEAATGTMELMDRGVDRATAAKAGAVRGVVMGASVAMPVVGQTVARTAGLVAIGGPGTFMAEQALTREILGRAGYQDIAREYEPFDPLGLGLSLAIPGAVGVALHRARIGKGVKSGEAMTEAQALDALAKDPEVVDAALVEHRTQTVLASAMGDTSDAGATTSHMRTLDAAAQALEEGEPVRAMDVLVDPVKAAPIIEDMQQRIRGVLDEAAKTEEVQVLRPEPAPRGPEWEMPGNLDISQVLDNAKHLLGVGRTADEAIADFSARGPLSGLMHNAFRGVEAFGQRLPELVEQYRALEANMGSYAPPMDILADAIERMTRGKMLAPANPALARAEMATREHPTLVARMDEGDQPMRAEDVINEAQMQSRQDLSDMRAFDAAVECFLRVGP